MRLIEARQLKKKKIKITNDKNGNIVAWNTPEFEKLKEKIGAEDDNRRVFLGPKDLCG